MILGHSLGEMDEHLVDVINSWRPPWREPLLAISVRPHEDLDRVRPRKLELAARLPHADILFFDSQTHPLGATTLAIA